MKYLLFDENAISKYVSVSMLQSIEYESGKRFVQHICGDLNSEIFFDTAIEYCEDGILFSGRKSETDTKTTNKILCIDLTTCNILSEKRKPGDLLTVIQKTLRVCLKIWNRLPFSSSERYNGSKSIVFPFIVTDGRRIVIERSSAVLGMEKRRIDFPLLAYKYSREEAPNGEEAVNTAVLKKAARDYSANYSNIQNKFKNTDTNTDTHELFEQINSKILKGRDEFIYWNYDMKYNNLTDAQKKVVDFSNINVPLRVDGAAGTGKTVSLIMRAYKLLNEYKEKGKPFNIIFFAHSDSTCRRNREMFSYYEGAEYFLEDNAPQRIKFSTLLNYCVEFSKSLNIESLLERDANDAKTYQLMLIDSVIEKAKQLNKYKTYRPLLSEEIRDLFEEEITERNVICSILQHEFSIQIKGRTDGTIDSYCELPSINNGLKCKNKKDKEFVFSLFNDYQTELKSLSVYDVDDAVIEALSRLNAPIWRRERATFGFDYIFVDEMHLFNINEQSVFHFLTRDITQKDVPICFALDYSQAIGDRGETSTDYIQRAFGKNLEQEKYNTVFRNSPEIAKLCASIATSGTLMFQESFLNPYESTQHNFTSEEEQHSTQPVLYMYKNDEDMLKALGNHLTTVINEIHCKTSDIAIISFDTNFFKDDNIERIKEIIAHDITLLNSSGKYEPNKCILASPYDVNGLEFKAVILLGADEGRVPQTMGTSDISQHYVKYSAYNLLYLSSSRAKYRLIALGNVLNGISSCFEHSIASEAIKVEYL